MLGLVVGKYDLDTSIDTLMADYSDNYRTFDCWECFNAKGKFCHDRNYELMFDVTRSSNPGHGVCCKPDYSGDHCNSDSDHECSQPAQISDTTSSFYPIVSEGELNH